MNNIDYQKMGEKIKLKRRESGYTQEALAEICNISTGFLGHIENGTRVPSLETLYSISCALHSGIDCFLFDSASTPDIALEQAASVIKNKNRDLYESFCNTVRILAEHIDEF